MKRYKPIFPLNEFVLADFKSGSQSMSPFTKEFRKERNSMKGVESSLAKVINVAFQKNGSLKVSLLTEGTHSFRVDTVNPKTLSSKFKADNLYDMEIEFLKMKEWKEGSWKDMTLKELREILTVVDLKLWCSCVSMQFQGLNYHLSQLGSSIYPTSIAPTSGPKGWKDRHNGKGALCKHLGGLVNSKTWLGAVLKAVKEKADRRWPIKE